MTHKTKRAQPLGRKRLVGADAGAGTARVSVPACSLHVTQLFPSWNLKEPAMKKCPRVLRTCSVSAAKSRTIRGLPGMDPSAYPLL